MNVNKEKGATSILSIATAPRYTHRSSSALYITSLLLCSPHVVHVGLGSSVLMFRSAFVQCDRNASSEMMYFVDDVFDFEVTLLCRLHHMNVLH